MALPILSVKSRTLLGLSRFRYEYATEDTGGEWQPITDDEELVRMLRLLGNAYNQVHLIVRSMQVGTEGRTMFTMYRAIRLDADEG